MGKHEKKRPEILPKPVPFYGHKYSKHPEVIRVSFKDGTSAVYDLRPKQPAPQIVECIEIIQGWTQGYPPIETR